MPTIHVDGRSYEVAGDRNLLHACLELGFDLPYFCWHPALGSVGACRQCAVKQFKDADDEHGRIVMACMTAAEDDARISIEDADATAFRTQVIEWLMLNHPHDCPICDEGGECHLQDMTVMTGHAYRRTRFPKRTYRNQDLGPLVNHEMNRCIQCYRCVRFYRDYAGGEDLDVFGAHDHVYFGRQEDGVLESPFAGNLVEVCPTGVFTDKTLKRHYTRKWDLQMAPAVCVHCALGCNVTAGARYGTLRRIVNRYNGDVNGYFLCDRGRYGYEFVNHPSRLRQALVRSGTKPRPVPPEEGLAAAVSALRSCDRVIGIGSPRASMESNFALRSLTGPENFFTGLGGREAMLVGETLRILRNGPVPSASPRDVEASDAVLLLGEDVENTAPRLALSLRQAARNQPMRGIGAQGVPPWHDHAVRNATFGRTGPLYVATPARTTLDRIAKSVVHAAPDDLARFGFAVAHAIDDASPAVEGLDEETRAVAAEVGAALAEAERPLVVSGPSCGSPAVLRAAANVAWALQRQERPVRIHLTARESNTMGVALLGGGTLEDAREVLDGMERVGVVVLERDLGRSVPPEVAEAILSGAAVRVVLDHIHTNTIEGADVVLPAATFAEDEGTLVSSEGRAQRFFRTLAPTPDGPRSSWYWLRELGRALGRIEASAWGRFDDLVADLATAVPALDGVARAAPGADLRLAGGKVPRQPARYSGRTAMTADVDVNVPAPPDDPSSPLAFSMEGSTEQPPAAVITSFWSPGWNSIQAVNKFQEEIGGPLRGGNPGVRLIEPEDGARPTYYDASSAAFTPEEGQWLILPSHHVFGSEELSSLAQGVAALAPKPYLGIGADDAARLSVESGQEVELTVDGRVLRVPAAVRPDIPDGVAMLPVGIAGLPVLDLPVIGTITVGAPR